MQLVAEHIGRFLGGLLLVFIVSRILRKTPLLGGTAGRELIFLSDALAGTSISLLLFLNMGAQAFISYIPPTIALLIWDLIKGTKKGMPESSAGDTSSEDNLSH